LLLKIRLMDQSPAQILPNIHFQLDELQALSDARDLLH
jgi:hypothetical protein